MDEIVVVTSGMPSWILTLVFGLALAALMILAQRHWGQRHDLYVFAALAALTWSSPIVFRVGDPPWLSAIPISLGLVALLAVPAIDRWPYQLALHGAMATFASGLSQLLVWLVVDELNAPEVLSIATQLAAPLLCAGLAMSMMRLRPRLYRGIQAMLQPGQPAPPVAPPTLLEPAPRQTAPSPHVGADVFISYKREERERVFAIAQALRDLQLTVWLDSRLMTGHSFDEEINREVRASKCVLVCWSPGAVESEWVRAEATIGRQRGVLTACFLEPCEPYPPFNLIHAEHLEAGPLNGANAAWAKLATQIGALVGRPGLGDYLLLETSGNRSALGAWIAENATDPLAERVLAKLRATA